LRASAAKRFAIAATVSFPTSGAITILAGYALTRLGFDVWAEFALLTLITFAGSFAGFEIARPIPLLRPLMGLKLKSKARRLSPA
jgi:hypothetical protein